MPFDGVNYLCCADCGEFVVECEAQAHEQSCGKAQLACRVCGGSVRLSELRDHLEQHNPGAANLEYSEVRDQFTAEAPVDEEFLGCLTGTIRFGPDWDKALPAEEWEALRP